MQTSNHTVLGKETAKGVQASLSASGKGHFDATASDVLDGWMAPLLKAN
jgi:hypothetical protein